MRGARKAALASLLVLGAIGVAGTAAFGSADGSSSARSYGSNRYGFQFGLPVGWHPARARLVPKLLDPLEILSVGTSVLPVGGGGDCDREPVAAIERMRPGDALLSVQEYTVTAAMRPRIGTGEAPPRLSIAIGELALRRALHRPGERIPALEDLWTATLPFTAHGRWFDALVYVRGRPAPARLRQVRAIIGSLRFRPSRSARGPAARRSGAGRPARARRAAAAAAGRARPAATRRARRRAA